MAVGSVRNNPVPQFLAPSTTITGGAGGLSTPTMGKESAFSALPQSRLGGFGDNFGGAFGAGNMGMSGSSYSGMMPSSNLMPSSYADMMQSSNLMPSSYGDTTSSPSDMMPSKLTAGGLAEEMGGLNKADVDNNKAFADLKGQVKFDEKGNMTNLKEVLGGMDKEKLGSLQKSFEADRGRNVNMAQMTEQMSGLNKADVEKNPAFADLKGAAKFDEKGNITNVKECLTGLSNEQMSKLQTGFSEDRSKNVGIKGLNEELSGLNKADVENNKAFADLKGAAKFDANGKISNIQDCLQGLNPEQLGKLKTGFEGDRARNVNIAGMTEQMGGLNKADVENNPAFADLKGKAKFDENGHITNTKEALQGLDDKQLGKLSQNFGSDRTRNIAVKDMTYQMKDMTKADIDSNPNFASIKDSLKYDDTGKITNLDPVLNGMDNKALQELGTKADILN